MNYNKRIISVMIGVCALFLSLAIYLTYFVVFEAEDIVTSSYNRRLWEKEDNVLRGDIFDRSGVLLASSEQKNDSQVRVYPYKGLYTHVIGYNSRTYGKTGLEAKYNDYLLSVDTLSEVLNFNDLGDTSMKKGADLRLTIDHQLTKKARSLMGNRNGAVVAINPKTGEVLCLYSNPTFDPSESVLTKKWNDLVNDDDAPFLPRATKGLYPPGSTFKVVTAASAIKNGYEDYTINDEGTIKIDGKEFSNDKKKSYGELDLVKGFAKSSNVMFASLATEIGERQLRNTIEDFYIGKEIPFDLSMSTSKFPYGKMSDTDLASVGIGQGKLLVTPMNMALIAATIANDGVMMKPYLLQSSTASSGRVLYSAKSQVLANVISSKLADDITNLMVECVESGTGSNAKVRSVEVAGKTGTAENEKNKTHAWFICFAPADDPQIAIAIVQEYRGSSGGAVCAPIAAELIKYWVNR